jgi:hypothetical protein
MRTTMIILLTIGLVSLSSCNQKTDPNTMLENSETRTALFDSIASNHNHMTEFIKNMQGNDHAMQMMQGNQMIMGNMIQGQGMQMMMNDSMMSMNMMHAMMKDGKMMNHMMQMMHNQGMMSEDCMNSSMQMMSAQEMNMGDMHNNSN